MPIDQITLSAMATGLISRQPGLTTHELFWQLTDDELSVSYEDLIQALYRTGRHHQVGQNAEGRWYSIHDNASVADNHRLGLPPCPYPGHEDPPPTTEADQFTTRDLTRIATVFESLADLLTGGSTQATAEEYKRLAVLARKQAKRP